MSALAESLRLVFGKGVPQFMEKPLLVVLVRVSLGRLGLGRRHFFLGQLLQQVPLPRRQGVGDQHPHLHQ